MGNHKYNTESFVNKAVEVHGNRYDYSQVVFISVTSKVRILCTEHGIFEQTPSGHLMGKGCFKCAAEVRSKSQTWTTPEFIQRARSKYGEKYDYSLTEYTRGSDSVIVVCPEHGAFSVRAAAHANGASACPECSGKKFWKKNSKQTIDDFLCRSVLAHGDKYDYSEVDYKTVNDKVTVVCPRHGAFSVRPVNHYEGTGCARCAQISTGASLRKTTEQFIDDAKAVHGNRYDYSLVDYVNNITKVKIVCKEHGEWLAPPNKHLLGTGCMSCAKAGFDSNKPGYVYVLSCAGTIKVGITNREVNKRADEVSKSAGKQFTIASSYYMHGADCARIEGQMLKHLRGSAIPVTDKYSGSTECFNGLSVETVIDIIEEKLTEDEQRQI